MISVETILLLQQKVESAVQKIERLKSENDALRAERSELTKALSEKSELLSRLSADEKKIEDGILGALSRLDSVENAILDAAAAKQGAPEAAQKADGAPLGAQEKAVSEAEEIRQEAPLAPSAQEPAAVYDASPKEREPAAPQAEQTLLQDEAPQGADGGQEDDLFGDTSFQTEEGDPDIF